jgi:hypothetical protein
LTGQDQGLAVVFTGLVVIADEPLNLAESAQCVGFHAPVTQLAGEGQGLGVVYAGLIAFADEPLNLAQAPKRAASPNR